MVLKRRQYFCWCDDLPYRLFSVDQVQILSHCKYKKQFPILHYFNPKLFAFIEIKSYLHCFKTNRTASSIKNHPFPPSQATFITPALFPPPRYPACIPTPSPKSISLSRKFPMKSPTATRPHQTCKRPRFVDRYR